MKKYISLIVCSVLLIFALVLGAPAKEVVVAGRGSGSDSRVTTVEQFVDVLDFFSNYEVQVPGVSAHSDASGYAASQQDEQIYTSATFYNKSKATVNSTSSYEGMTQSMSSNYTREMSIYLTKTAALYHSVGVVLTSGTVIAEGETESYSMMFDFDMYIYFNAEDCFVRFQKWDVTASGEDVSSIDFVKSDMIGKWYNAGVLGGELLAINGENYELLGGIGDYFEEYKLTKFNQSGKVYTLKDEHLYEVFSLIFGNQFPEDVRGGFTLNLSNRVQPTMTIHQAYSNSDGENGYFSTITSYAENNIKFSNINNTMIDSSKINPNSPKLEDLIEEDVL